MTMTKTKKNNYLNVGSMKNTLQQLRKWKLNREKFYSAYKLELDNSVIDKSIVEMEKCVRYFEQNKIHDITL